jgi:hypothetical protein
MTLKQQTAPRYNNIGPAKSSRDKDCPGSNPNPIKPHPTAPTGSTQGSRVPNPMWIEHVHTT